MPETRTAPASIAGRRIRAGRRVLALVIALSWAVAACSAGSGPAPIGTPGASPGASGSAASGAPASPPAAAAVDSVAGAAAAVGAFDTNFLGYASRNPDLIGQSAWFEGREVPGGFELTFFRGAGDCPAGCIERSFIKFFVSRAGNVEKRCEWQEGGAASGTPC